MTASSAALRMLVAVAVTSLVVCPPAWAQPSASPTTDTAAGEVSPSSLARIRNALQLERDSELTPVVQLGINENLWLQDMQPGLQLPGEVEFLGGVNLFEDPTYVRGPVPSGGPTHTDMLRSMAQRDVTEAGATDVLGIATASALAFVPAAIKGIAGWFGGDEEQQTTPPILTPGNEALAVSGTMAAGDVLEAGIQQRGRMVDISLTVTDETPTATARTLGETFVRLVKSLSEAEPPPGQELGIGEFDYVIRIGTPIVAERSRGRKTSTQDQITW